MNEAVQQTSPPINRLMMLGLSHHTAPLAVRERFAMDELQQQQFLTTLQGRWPACEAVLLSTCNRVELYLARPAHEHPRREDVVAALAGVCGQAPSMIDSRLNEISGRVAVEHLFMVAAGLDAMIVGESQILGQVRSAYDRSSSLGLAGPTMHALFQRAIAAGREVQEMTALGRGHFSVAGAAVSYAAGIVGRMDDKSVLCVGAGKMSGIVLRSFASLKPRRLVVANRSTDRARELADEFACGMGAEFSGDGVSLSSLPQHLAEADVVITSTGSPVPIITRSMCESIVPARCGRAMVFVDIAVPRDVEPGVATLPRMHVRNLDDLQHAVAADDLGRRESIGVARAVVLKHVEAHLAAQRQRDIGPAIAKLYERFHFAARAEARRAAAGLGEDEAARVDEAARRIVNRLLHGPMKALREADPTDGPTAQYLRAMEKLFALGDDPGVDE